MKHYFYFKKGQPVPTWLFRPTSLVPNQWMTFTANGKVMVDDLIWYDGDDELSYGEYHVMEIEAPVYEGYRTVLVNGGNFGHWIDTRAGWGFIHRP